MQTEGGPAIGMFDRAAKHASQVIAPFGTSLVVNFSDRHIVGYLPWGAHPEATAPIVSTCRIADH